MKVALFLITMTMSFSVFAAPHEEAADKNEGGETPTCMFEAPDVGKIKFRGATREQAFEQTSRVCLQTRVETFIRKKGTAPTSERKILFAEDCVNKTYCKH